MEDFKITVPMELMARAENARLLFIGMMGLVAGISLLVGGIGIWNIAQLLSPPAYSNGSRRALGARRSDITRQFLSETVVSRLL